MKYRLLLLTVALSTCFGSFIYQANADEQRTHRVIENPVQDGNLVLRINDGGTKKDAISINGSTAVASFLNSPLVGVDPILSESFTSTTVSSTGHNPQAVSVQFRLAKFGNMVILQWPEFTVGSTVGAGYFSFSTVTVPAGYRPIQAITQTVSSIEGNVDVNGAVIIGADGSLRFGATSRADTFSGTTLNGVRAGTAIWFLY